MKRIAASLVFATLWLGPALCAAAPPTPGPSEEVRGRISAVELDGTIIVVSPVGNPVGFNVNPRTAMVERGGKPATFGDLRQGDEVHVRLSGDVLQIVANPPETGVPPKVP